MAINMEQIKKHPIAIAATILATVVALFVAVVEVDDRYAKSQDLIDTKNELKATLVNTDKGVRLTHLSSQEQGLKVQQILYDQQLTTAIKKKDDASVASLTRKLNSLEVQIDRVMQEKYELKKEIWSRAQFGSDDTDINFAESRSSSDRSAVFSVSGQLIDAPAAPVTEPIQERHMAELRAPEPAAPDDGATAFMPALPPPPADLENVAPAASPPPD